MTIKQRKDIATWVLMGKFLDNEANDMQLMLHFIQKEQYKCSINDLVEIGALMRELSKTLKFKRVERQIGDSVAVFVEIDE
jgi:hypothetical protein